MSLETITAEQFRSVFGDVPELTQPVVFTEGRGKIVVPFDQFQISDHGSMGKLGILETFPFAEHHIEPCDDPRSYPDASTLIRVKYDSLYGLKARTWQALRRITRDAWSDEEKKEPELLLLFGHMQYDFGPVSIYYRAMPVSSFHANYDFFLRDPSAYKVSIEVMPNSSDLEEKPSPARVSYTKEGIEIPLRGEFVNTEYDEALTNGVEERSSGSFVSLRYPYTYFLWKYLGGIRLGSTRFKNNKSSELNGFERPANLNPARQYLLRGSPYKAGVYFGYREGGGINPGERTVSFVRMNKKTGESWVLSVPDWIDGHRFMSDLSNEPFMNFYYKYPVVFGVRRPGQEDIWLRTHGNQKREEAILNAAGRALLK